MNPPHEALYQEWRDLFFENIEPSFLSDEIVDYCDDQFGEWVGMYSDEDRRPEHSAIIKFAWQINQELAEMEASALSATKGD